MTNLQRLIKYGAIALAAILIVTIFGTALRLLSLMGHIAEGDAVAEEMTAYSVTQELTSLKMELPGADLTVRQGDRLCVESNLKNLTVQEKNGTLIIQEKDSFAFDYTGASLILTLPAELRFAQAELELGAGRVTVERLSAENLKLKFGTGDVRISLLEGTEHTDIECGVGNVTISGGTLRDLELDLGVGSTQITAGLPGNSRCACGVGSLKLTVLGNREAYRLELHKGIGSVRLDGKLLSGNETVGDGENHLRVNGGVGNLSITFQEAP